MKSVLFGSLSVLCFAIAILGGLTGKVLALVWCIWDVINMIQTSDFSFMRILGLVLVYILRGIIVCVFALFFSLCGFLCIYLRGSEINYVRRTQTY